MTALITGASGGIGAELARLFASDGFDLVLVARRKEKLIELKNELESAHKIKVSVFECDLSKDGAAMEVLAFTKEEALSVDVLVNNAGFGDWGLFADCNLEKQNQMIHLNILALTELTRLFLPQMTARKSGRILNVASIASFMPGPKMSVYYASKAFVRSFTEALSVELKNSGVTVTALCPGPVATDFWDRAEAGSSKIFKSLIFADSKYIAKYGYKKLMKGKVLALPGLSTQIFAFLTKIMPGNLVRNMVYKIQK